MATEYSVADHDGGYLKRFLIANRRLALITDLSQVAIAPGARSPNCARASDDISQRLWRAYRPVLYLGCPIGWPGQAGGAVLVVSA